MEIVIVAVVACLVFAACFAVFMLKARKGENGGRLHTCGQPENCRCRNNGEPSEK